VSTAVGVDDVVLGVPDVVELVVGGVGVCVGSADLLLVTARGRGQH